MDGDAAVAVCLGESSALNYHHHRTGMDVPSGFAARLKNEKRLQGIGGSSHMHIGSPGRAEALGQPGDLQWGRLAMRNAQADQSEHEHSR